MGSTIKATSERPTMKPASPAIAERRPLFVAAQASQPPSGVLVLHVDVRDSTGQPVRGLRKQDFQVLQLPGGVGELPVMNVQDQGTSHPERAGLYTLQFNAWSAPNPGLIAYRVRVHHDADAGAAMTHLLIAN